MIKNIFRSILAVVVALFATFVLSYGTDALLRATNVLPNGSFYVSWLLILAVIFYRSIYSAVGSYIAAALAPNHPMSHAMGLGIFGFVVSAITAVATWNLRIGPHWYPLTLAVFSIPSAWLGGKFSVIRRAERGVGKRVLGGESESEMRRRTAVE
jgi:hypothetical protein